MSKQKTESLVHVAKDDKTGQYRIVDDLTGEVSFAMKKDGTMSEKPRDGGGHDHLDKVSRQVEKHINPSIVTANKRKEQENAV